MSTGYTTGITFQDRQGKVFHVDATEIGEGGAAKVYKFARPEGVDLPGNAQQLIAKVSLTNDAGSMERMDREVCRDDDVNTKPHQVRQFHACLGRAGMAARPMSIGPYGGKTLSLFSEDQRDPHGLPARKVFEPDEAAKTVVEVALGLREGFVHRDIKPDNIVIDERGTASLIDFGLERPSGFVGPISGTPTHMAPEAHRAGFSGRTAYTPKNDAYAIGVLLHEMTSGEDFCRADAMSPICISEDGKRPNRDRIVAAIGDAARRNDPEKRWDPTTIAAHAQFLMPSVDRNRVVGPEHAPRFAEAIGRTLATETDPELRKVSRVAGQALLSIPGVNKEQLRSLMDGPEKERALTVEQVRTPVPAHATPSVQRPQPVAEEPEPEAPVRPRHVMSR